MQTPDSFFNSPRQLERFGFPAKRAGKSIGLRINPECSTQKGHAIYDPCAPGSRLGTTRAQWDKKMTPELTGLLDGLHFHTLCEQDSDALEITLNAVEKHFGDLLPRMKWLNFGGGAGQFSRFLCAVQRRPVGHFQYVRRMAGSAGIQDEMAQFRRRAPHYQTRIRYPPAGEVHPLGAGTAAARQNCNPPSHPRPDRWDRPGGRCRAVLPVPLRRTQHRADGIRGISAPLLLQKTLGRYSARTSGLPSQIR